ncbi:carbohydrate ABC transporter membrane protein 1 (CUT1 family) [Halanaerobium saccharolyticum]|uniref:Carbohydrate ABC transporter membrane protein 1 (CUT1 family) n=1 Tax=Halanaerobium saccharolyticum TaxID=43595 RepID=A0A4V3CFK2_9FIRM|nr:sugar ABC transporter permease [Halanaerobium saccharolyticum]TDO94122.1 carbohydrate ABC transporter membrane protein 1 (CUT1 family) [Halanaerobium saccharolyticum]
MLEKIKKSKMIYIIPAFLLLGLVLVFPIIYSINISFKNYVMTLPFREVVYVGLDNYIDVLTDPRFYNSLKVTLIITFGSLTLQLIFGLSLAIALNNKLMEENKLLKSQTIRGVLFIPSMLMGVIIGLMWQLGLNPTYGIFNEWLSYLFGTQSYFSSSTLAIPTIVFIEFWRGTPMVMLILAAGLKGIPMTPYEAADVDGATSWQKFVYITLPLLKPVLVITIILRTMDVLRIFDFIFITTSGGPGNLTEVLSIYAYNTSFVSMRISQGAAISWVITLIILIFSFIYFKYLYKRE